MTIFGFDEPTVDRLIAAVRNADRSIDGEERAALVARAAWSGIAEPGDGTAGSLIATIGPSLALRSVLEGWPADRVLGIMREHDLDSAATVKPELAAAVKRWQPRLKSAEVLHALEQAARVGAALVAPNDPGWPGGLHDLGRHSPIALWLRGKSAVCARLERSIALVGARAASGYGEQVTMDASAGLAERGFAIVSGAAYGIDGMAHRAALAADGVTVAFLAGGVDRFYPSGHDALLSRIVAAGAVISEVPCGAAPTKWRFLQRNRLIAASASATVVVEAGRRSGSLNTAGHAAALGRPLGAVPGPVTSPTSAGCHRLIRDYDAICVTTVEEMSELVDGAAVTDRALLGDPTTEETRVFDALSVRAARDVQDIAARAGLAASTVVAALGLLELTGRVREAERGWVRTS
ncbi:DNA-processing protein DprA [Rathayibacter soli]|uniref:DNA-processing protein DprA n=1 Tax=Rathayibacter soli TaxID=3144168 RepID=UPI0027E52A51|nr:DNA-processing protein DprA [Glaciibacter superstes]